MNSATKKVIAAAVVVLMLTVVTISANAVVTKSDADKSLTLISQVNTDGSILFLDEKYTPSDFVDVNGGTITYKPDAWDGMIFGTPGTTSIQHKMLQSIVMNDLGFAFKPYTQNMTKESKTVYYDATLTNAAVWKQSEFMDGGIVWEPVCSAIISGVDGRGADELLNSNQIKPGHACCVIAATNSYVSTHVESTIRFLAAYIESVKALNDAKVNPSKYNELVKFAMKNTGQPEHVVTDALKNVMYTYGGSGDTPLNNLRNDVAEMVELFSIDKTFRVSLEELGFHSGEEFANAFINDTYLAKALKFGPSTGDYDHVRIKIAVIKGDIHQIALSYGIEQGIFDKYNMSIDTMPAANGAGVVTSLQNGAVSMGLMGTPPITITTVNSKLVTEKDATVTGRAVDANGNPISNAVIELMDVTYGTFKVVATAITDSDGKFKIVTYVGSLGYLHIRDAVLLVTIDRVSQNIDMGNIMLKVIG